ncbi:TadE/TadG family type IV pilus assembly protein [Neobacillus drentensis]|uniref:TadE/TadG family type IV pilus assembly protein n=1 Tax=Neobacillus drentensis TaxID=220684 RepID=UPI000824DD9B|nr:TadE/TadG family type IV pilus assembly protein [Neobacillus drentensis]
MKSEKGQSLVEFALILPLFLMLLFGIVDFGRAFHAYLTIDHAGREAARAASIGKDNAAVKLVAKKQGSSIGLNEDRVDISTASRTPGTDITITINYQFNFITPVLGPLVKTINLKDTTVMRVE